MKKQSNLKQVLYIGIAFITIAGTSVFNEVKAQAFDGHNCIQSTGLEEYDPNDATIDYDTSGQNVTASADIEKLWGSSYYDGLMNDVYLSFAFQRAAKGNAGFAFHFNTDCDSTNNNVNFGGADHALFFSVQTGVVQDSNVYAWDNATSAYVTTGETFTAKIGGSTCLTNSDEEFFEFRVEASKIFNLCNATCGTIIFTNATIHAGGSFNSTIKDTMLLGNSVFINTAPVADIQTGPACTGTPMDFTAFLSTENNSVNTVYDDVIDYDWDFNNDGLWDGINADSTTYTFNSAGSYTVRLLVTDVFDCKDSTTLVVTPQAPPTASLIQDVHTYAQWCEDFIFYYTDFSVDVNGDPVASRFWTLPDATTHTDSTFLHSYAECLWNETSPGVYYYGNLELTLEVTDSIGCVSTLTLPALPVDLTYFKGEVIDGNAVLAWETASEVNSSHFVVERSTDGANFIEIGTVQGAGFTQEISNYMFIDENMEAGNNFYRLTQFDYDGKSETFDPIVLNAEQGGPRITVSPNPAMDMVTVALPSSTEASQITILDVAGKTLMTQDIKASMDNSSIQLDLSSLPEGLYYINYGNAKEGYTTQMIQLL